MAHKATPTLPRGCVSSNRWTAARQCGLREDARRRWRRIFPFILTLVLDGGSLEAQGTITVLQTGGGHPLVSQQESVSLAGITAPVILFDFGFVTDEVPVPNTFLDAFTVTFQGASPNQTAVLATADASGILWAPASPGGLVVTDSQIQRQATQPPSLQPILGRGVAFSVQVSVPAGFTGPTLTVDFDLFDNLNQAMSAGWYTTPLAVSVPEPQAWMLFGPGLFVLAMKRRQKR